MPLEPSNISIKDKIYYALNNADRPLSITAISEITKLSEKTLKHRMSHYINDIKSIPDRHQKHKPLYYLVNKHDFSSELYSQTNLKGVQNFYASIEA